MTFYGNCGKIAARLRDRGIERAIGEIAAAIENDAGGDKAIAHQMSAAILSDRAAFESFARTFDGDRRTLQVRIGSADGENERATIFEAFLIFCFGVAFGAALVFGIFLATGVLE